MDTATVTSKGQLVIPAGLRRRHGIKPGTKVRFIERGSEILFQPVTSAYIRSLCGILKSETLVTRELLEDRMLDKRREEEQAEKLYSR